MNTQCAHIGEALVRKTHVLPSSNGCKECLASGDRWVHLRICLSCGHIGCCDDSPNRHATQHFRLTKHPVIRSFEPGEDWGWCYEDRQYAPYLPANSSEIAIEHFDAPSSPAS